jgi:hypothetical protein
MNAFENHMEYAREIVLLQGDDMYWEVQANFPTYLKQLWEEYMTSRFKKSDKTLDKDMADKIHSMYINIENIGKKKNLQRETLEYLAMRREKGVGYMTGYNWLDKSI